MIGYIFGSTLKDFLRPQRILAWILITLVVGVLSAIIARLIPESGPNEKYGHLAGMFAFRICALAGALFSALVLSAEVEQKTIVYLVTRPVPRAKIIVGRALAAMVATFAVSALAVVAIGLAVPKVGLTNAFVLKDLLVVALGSAAYVSLFVLITLMVNKAMLLCLLYTFAWETAVPNMPGSTFYLSINSYMNSLADHQVIGGLGIFDIMSGQAALNQLKPVTAAIVLAGIAVVLLAVNARYFSKFEFVPREDTE